MIMVLSEPSLRVSKKTTASIMAPLKDFYSKLAQVNQPYLHPKLSLSLWKKQILIVHSDWKGNGCDKCKILRNRSHYIQIWRHALKPHPIFRSHFFPVLPPFQVRVIELKTWVCKIYLKQRCSWQRNQGVSFIQHAYPYQHHLII